MGLPSHGSTFQTEHHCVVNGRSLPQPPFDIPSLGLRGHPIGATGHPTAETPPEDSDYGEPVNPDKLQSMAEKFLAAAEKNRKRLRDYSPVQFGQGSTPMGTLDGRRSLSDAGAAYLEAAVRRRPAFDSEFNWLARLERAETEHHMYVKAAVRRTK